MDKIDTRTLLAMCAAYDQRTVGQADIEAWAATMPHVQLEDAEIAVIRHYQRETRRIMPADVVKGAAVERREQEREEEQATLFGPTRQRRISAPMQAAMDALPPELAHHPKLRAAVEESDRRCKHYRALILRHGDLAARLCEPPLDFKRPGQWTGYVPPELDQENEPERLRSPGGHPNTRGKETDPRGVNHSPVRYALLELIGKARELEAAESRDNVSADWQEGCG